MSAQGFLATNHFDAAGNPAGGDVIGTGLKIDWQNGPLLVPVLAKDRSGLVHERREPNGAFVEDVIAAAKQRLEHYQTSKFACRENALAITKLDEALHWLGHRTADRIARGVEGSHKL